MRSLITKGPTPTEHKREILPVTTEMIKNSKAQSRKRVWDVERIEGEHIGKIADGDAVYEGKTPAIRE